MEQTDVAQVLTYFGKPVPEAGSGEFRMPCIFSDACADSSYGALTVNLDDPANRIYCHSCNVRGNLLTLIHGLKHGQPPSGGRLRGDEFKDAVTTLKQIGESEHSHQPNVKVKEPDRLSKSVETLENVPLNQREKTAGLANLYEDLVVDVGQMPPEAAAYFRRRPWLTPEVCRKWKMGYLPSSGRSLLRGYIVYAHQNQAGEIISYSGRDVRFDEKWDKWVRHGREEKRKSRPMKHRYVKGFHKGIELYGQHTSRLQELPIKKSLGTIGVVVVEGQNDVIRLDCLGVAAVGLCMNKATDAQLDHLANLAAATCGQVVLMPDNDEQGQAGFKELLWQLASRGVVTKLAWSNESHDARFQGAQPEDVSEKDWQTSILPRLLRG